MTVGATPRKSFGGTASRAWSFLRHCWFKTFSTCHRRLDLRRAGPVSRSDRTETDERSDQPSPDDPVSSPNTVFTGNFMDGKRSVSLTPFFRAASIVE